jgi:hypothetical protein
MTVVRDPLDGSNAFCVESRGMTSLGATTPRARHVPRGGGGGGGGGGLFFGTFGIPPRWF